VSTFRGMRWVVSVTNTAEVEVRGGFAFFQGTSNGGRRSSSRKTRVNRRSDLPCNGTTWRFDRLFLHNWRPPFEVPWKPAKECRCRPPASHSALTVGWSAV
jgi:hypothetical protein